MEVKTSVDEADIGKVKQGQRIEFTVDAYPELKFDGTGSEVRLQPVTTNSVVTYHVILHAPNPEKKLMPGMTASATIFVEEKSNVLILAAKAMRFRPDEAFMQRIFSEQKEMKLLRGTQEGMKRVWIKDGNGGIRPVPVKTGIENGTSVEIASGLNEWDEVIITMQGGKTERSEASGNQGQKGPFPGYGPQGG